MKRFLVVGLAVTTALVVVVSLLLVEVSDEMRRRRQETALTTLTHEWEYRFFQQRRPEAEWLAAQSAVRAYLADPVPSELPAVSSLLAQAAGQLDLEAAYLVGGNGLIRASSDSRFVGTDVSERDYFRRGLSGLPAYAIGIGLVTKTRGLYASVPVFNAGRVVGLAVFRTAAAALDSWQRSHPGILILEPDGSVFSSVDPRFPAGQTWFGRDTDHLTVAGRGFRVSRHPLETVPGYSLASVVADEWPWALVLIVDVGLLLLVFSGTLVARQARLVRQRRNEDRERHQREQLLSHLREGIAVFDGKGELTWSNEAFDSLLERGEGQPLPSLDELWDRSGAGPWREVLDGTRPWVVFESVLRGLRGAWVPVSAGFTAAGDRYLLSVLDGSERYRSDQLIRQSQKLTVLGQLSGGIAHDLNNMLGVLMGMADLLKVSLPEHDPLQESVDLILVTLARASGLSERMLNFARQTPMNRVRLDVSALLRELRFLARTALPAGVQAEVSVPEGSLEVEGDENLLISALLNLVLNAGDAMPNGGLVTVSASVVGPKVMLVVADQGTGMDQATLARIFEPFFSTKHGKGTGLGLSLVRRTVLEHRGTIEVVSSLGVGTRVTVGLPLVPPIRLLASGLPTQG